MWPPVSGFAANWAMKEKAGVWSESARPGAAGALLHDRHVFPLPHLVYAYPHAHPPAPFCLAAD